MKRLKSAVRLIGLLLFRPERFVQDTTQDAINRELARNEELRAQHPDGVLPPEKREQFANNERTRSTRLRRALAGGFGSVVATVALAWLSGLLAHRLLGPAPPWLTLTLQVAAAAILLGATLSVLGWEIQSWKGDTLPERVNRWIFRALYVLGTYLLLISMCWAADSTSLSPVSTRSDLWAELLVTLIGTFAGVFLAFWLDRRQQEAHAKEGYANTLNSIRADLANLGAICRHVAEHLGRSEVRTALLPIEAPALDAALTNSAFYDRAPYGLLTCLIVLATSRRAIQNVLAQNQPPPPSELKPMVEELVRTICYVQKALDQEIQPLGKPIIRTPSDVQVLDGLKAARRGEDAQTRSDKMT